MADLVPLDPFSLIKPRSQPDDPLGYWWQQVGNVGRATFGVEPVNKIPRPMLTQTYPDAWALAPHVAGMLSPYLAARDAATSMNEASRDAAAGDIWGAARNLGIGALNVAAIVPAGRMVKPVKLAMDEASRLARARKLGYSEEPFYRGERGGTLRPSYLGGAHFSRNKEYADAFARAGGFPESREFRLDTRRAFRDEDSLNAAQYARLVAAADPRLAAGLVDMIAPGRDVPWFLGFAQALPNTTVSHASAIVRQAIEQGASNPAEVFRRAGFDALDSGRDVLKLTGRGIRLKDAAFDPRRANAYDIMKSLLLAAPVGGTAMGIAWPPLVPDEATTP